MSKLEQLPDISSVDDASVFLNSLSIDEGLLTKANDAIILPRKLVSADGENVFEPETKSLVRALRQRGLSADIYDDGKAQTTYFAFSEDVLFYLAIAVKEVVVPIVTMVISSIISSKIISAKNGTAKVDVIILEDGTSGKRLIRIQGAVDDVLKSLHALGQADDKERGQNGEHGVEKKPGIDSAGEESSQPRTDGRG